MIAVAFLASNNISIERGVKELMDMPLLTSVYAEENRQKRREMLNVLESTCKEFNDTPRRRQIAIEFKYVTLAMKHQQKINHRVDPHYAYWKLDWFRVWSHKPSLLNEPISLAFLVVKDIRKVYVIEELAGLPLSVGNLTEDLPIAEGRKCLKDISAGKFRAAFEYSHRARD